MILIKMQVTDDLTLCKLQMIPVKQHVMDDKRHGKLQIVPIGLLAIYDQRLGSNGGCRREEKSRKHWSLFIKLLSSVTAIFFIC